nr:MAG TPA: SLDH Membrane bound FAD containing D-sorbitol dehydrogenase [Bacteriophage sp.]
MFEIVHIYKQLEKSVFMRLSEILTGFNYSRKFYLANSTGQ